MNGFDGIGDTSCYIHVIDATLCVNSYIYISLVKYQYQRYKLHLWKITSIRHIYSLGPSSTAPAHSQVAEAASKLKRDIVSQGRCKLCSHSQVRCDVLGHCELAPRCSISQRRWEADADGAKSIAMQWTGHGPRSDRCRSTGAKSEVNYQSWSFYCVLD